MAVLRALEKTAQVEGCHDGRLSVPVSDRLAQVEPKAHGKDSFVSWALGLWSGMTRIELA